MPHATIFKPTHPYKRCVAETFKDFPPSALALTEVLLAVEPECRGTASSALQNEVIIVAFLSAIRFSISLIVCFVQRKRYTEKGSGCISYLAGRKRERIGKVERFDNTLGPTIFLLPKNVV